MATTESKCIDDEGTFPWVNISLKDTYTDANNSDMPKGKCDVVSFSEKVNIFKLIIKVYLLADIDKI